MALGRGEVCHVLALIGALHLAAGCGWREDGEATIRPGQEQSLAAMLNPGGLSTDCRWTGGDIDRRIVVGRYRCSDGSEHALTLRHRSARVSAAATTQKFALVAPPEFPRDLLAAVSAQIRAHEHGFQWQSPSGRDRGAASLLERLLEQLGVRFRGGTAAAAALVISFNLFALAVLMLTRRRRPQERPMMPLSFNAAVAPALAVVALIVALTMAARFRFQLDDYLYMEIAHVCPDCLDESLRVLSTDVLFRAGRLIGDWWLFFAACNLLMLALAAVLWTRLLRRLQFSTDEAVLAGALLTFAPGTYLLLRYASGFQQLAANAVVFAVLLMIDGAARANGDAAAPWRRAQIVSAFALGMLGVLVKYPVMAILPVSTWIWARWMVPESAQSLRRPWVHLGLGGALLIPLLVGHETRERSGEIGKLGLAGIRSNATYLGDLLIGEWLMGIAAASLVLVIIGLICGVVVVRRGVEPTQETSPPSSSTWQSTLSMGVLACLWLSPFLLNAEYAKPYYVTLMTAPLAAIAARLLCRAASAVRPMWLSAVIAVPLLFPYQQVATEWEFMPEDELISRLEEVRRIAEGHSPPRRIGLTARCRTTADNAASAARLVEIHARSERGSAFRWATGWYQADVAILPRGADRISGEDDDTFALAYCIGEPLQLIERR